MNASILHLLAPGEAGGLESVVESLAAAQAATGQRVSVAAILDAPRTEHPLLDALRDARVEVRACPVPLRAYREERRRVRGVVAEVSPGVVHTHGYRTDVLDADVVRRMGVPTVTTVHGFTGGGLKNRAYEWLQCRAFRRFAAVVAVSRPLRDELMVRGVPAGRVHLIRNAWANGAPPLSRPEARAELGIAPDAWTIGWVGRLSREKGPDVLVEALARLAETGVAAAMLGDGRLRPELRQRAAALGLEARIRWHGTVPRAGRLFPAFDCFVLSSRTEGTPIALFEAMAAGVPVVATRVGGVPDVVSADEAILVPSEDPDALAAAVRAVRADPAGARERAARARARLRSEFAVETWLRKYQMIYRDVSAAARDGAAA